MMLPDASFDYSTQRQLKPEAVKKNGDKIPDKLIRVTFSKSLTVLLLFKDQSRSISLSPCIVQFRTKSIYSGSKKLPLRREKQRKKLMLGDTNK
jgi:hypothetical protein